MEYLPLVFAFVIYTLVNYFSLQKASFFYLKTKQNSRTAIESVILILSTLLLLNGWAFYSEYKNNMEEGTSLIRILAFILFFTLPPLVYRIRLRNSGDGKLNKKQATVVYLWQLGLIILLSLIILAVLFAVSFVLKLF